MTATSTLDPADHRGAGRRLRRRADRAWPTCSTSYRDRVVVAEIDTNEPVERRRRHRAVRLVRPAGVRPRRDRASWSSNPRARRVVVYTWNFHPDLVESARQQGVHGYLSKTLPARELVAALEAVHAGEVVVSDPPARARSAQRAGLAGPRRGPHRPRVGDPRADHPGQEQRRGRRADLPEPQHRQVLHPHASTARSASPAAPRPCCGASTTASPPTTTASTTGAPRRNPSPGVENR